MYIYRVKKKGVGMIEEKIIQLENEVEKLKSIKAEIKSKRKKRNYSGSKLRPYFIEAKKLKEDYKFSFADISLWLKTFKKIKMKPDGVRSAYRRIEKEDEISGEG